MTVDFFELQGCEPGQIINCSIKNTELQVEVFKLDHTVTCNGYGISLKKQKLKEEYKDLPGPEIGKLRKQGVEITQLVTEPFLAYILDTDSSFFHTNDNPHSSLFSYTTIVTECTFLLEEHFEAAKNNKHIIWKELLPFVKKFPKITFVLCHFSLRYSVTDIEAFFEKEKKMHSIDNIFVWLN